MTFHFIHFILTHPHVLSVADFGNAYDGFRVSSEALSGCRQMPPVKPVVNDILRGFVSQAPTMMATMIWHLATTLRSATLYVTYQSIVQCLPDISLSQVMSWLLDTPLKHANTAAAAAVGADGDAEDEQWRHMMSRDPSRACRPTVDGYLAHICRIFQLNIYTVASPEFKGSGKAGKGSPLFVPHLSFTLSPFPPFRPFPPLFILSLFLSLISLPESR